MRLVCGPASSKLSLNVPVATIDIGATVLDIAGATMYRDEKMTARSFRGLLKGAVRELNRTFIQWASEVDFDKGSRPKTFPRFGLWCLWQRSPDVQVCVLQGQMPRRTELCRTARPDGYTRLLYTLLQTRSTCTTRGKAVFPAWRELPVVHGFNCLAAPQRRRA